MQGNIFFIYQTGLAPVRSKVNLNLKKKKWEVKFFRSDLV